MVSGNETKDITTSGDSLNGVDATADIRPDTSAFVNATLVTEQGALDDVIRTVVKAPVIGLDIETTGYNPKYHKNGVKPSEGTIRTIQVATKNPEPRQFVIDCWRVDPTQLLEALYSTPAKPWILQPARVTIIHYAWFEAEWLAHHYGVTLGKVFDTCAATRKLNTFNKAQRARAKCQVGKSLFADVDPWYAPLGEATGNVLPDAKLATVSLALAGVVLNKAFQGSPWDQSRLTRGQVDYAATDAAILLELAPTLKERCIAAGVLADVEAMSDKPAKACAWLHEKHSSDQRACQRVLRALEASEEYEEASKVSRCLGQLSLRWDDRMTLRKRAQRRAIELLEAREPATNDAVYGYAPSTLEEDRRAYERTPALAA
jgi:ribonuclease D